MAVDTGRRRRRALSMTSLIDVIFLLLLFFMLSSTFSRFAEVELASAAPGGAGAAQGTPLFLSVDPGRLRLNGSDVAAEALSDAVTQAGGGRVLVSLSDAVLSQQLIDVLGSLRSIADLQVTVLQ